MQGQLIDLARALAPATKTQSLMASQRANNLRMLKQIIGTGCPC